MTNTNIIAKEQIQKGDLTMKINEKFTTNHARQLNEGRISPNAIYRAVWCQCEYYTDIAHMLTVAATANYLDGFDKDNLPAPEDAAHGLLQKTVDTFRNFNEKLYENERPLPIPEELTSYQVAKLMLALYHIRLVFDENKSVYLGEELEIDETSLQDPDYYTVMLYVDDKSDIYGGGIGIGAYTCEFWPLVDTLSPYSMENSFSDFVYFAQEVEFWLRIFAKKAESSELQGFMLLKNGVLNCQTKELLPFSPEYVFIEGIGTGVYEEGEDGPVIRLGEDIKVSVNNWQRI